MKLIFMILVAALCFFGILAKSKKSVNDDENPQKENDNTWAVLIAGSKGWDNYRHQADICHSYHTLIENGLKSEHIIVIMYDDIAFNEKNKYPGKIFNGPNKKDVYEGVKIDYSGKNANSETFLNVLKGNKTGNAGKGSGRVLESGPSDNIFVFYVSHGGSQILEMPENSFVHRNDLYDAFKIMNENKMYQKMLFYLESCLSGSLFEALDPEWNIYAITASSETESSFATYCNIINDLPCLGDLFSVSWMKDSETHDILSERVGTQFDQIKVATTSSNVSEYGNRLIRSDPLALYQGSTDEIKCPDPISPDTYNGEIIDSQEVAFLMAEKTAFQNGFSKSQVYALMKNYTKMRNEITNFVIDVVKASVDNERDVGKVLTAKLSRYVQSECHQKVIQAFDKCIPLSENSYALRFSQIFANLCEILKSDVAIIENLHKKCQNGPLFIGAI